MKKPGRVLVADDHVMFREAVENWLRPHYEVVPGVSRKAELFSAFAIGGFDVALLDLSWGTEGGSFEWIPELLRRQSTARILMLSHYNDWALCQTALKLGACGYLVKHSTLGDLLPGIEAALAGHQYLSSLLRREHESGRQRDQYLLTQYQLRLLQHLAAKLSRRQIAAIEGKDMSGIGYHITLIRKRFNIPPSELNPWARILMSLRREDVQEEGH